MTYTAIRQTIFDGFRLSITEVLPLATDFPNDSTFQKPSSMDVPYCRPRVVWGGAEARNIGALVTGGQKRTTAEGVLVVMLFYPIGDGSDAIDTAADAVMAAHRLKRIGAARFRVPWPTDAAEVVDGYYQLPVRCPFSVDEVFSA